MYQLVKVNNINSIVSRIYSHAFSSVEHALGHNNRTWFGRGLQAKRNEIKLVNSVGVTISPKPKPKPSSRPPCGAAQTASSEVHIMTPPCPSIFCKTRNNTNHVISCTIPINTKSRLCSAMNSWINDGKLISSSSSCSWLDIALIANG